MLGQWSHPSLLAASRSFSLQLVPAVAEEHLLRAQPTCGTRSVDRKRPSIPGPPGLTGEASSSGSEQIPQLAAGRCWLMTVMSGAPAVASAPPPTLLATATRPAADAREGVRI